ncbi:MAG: Cys-Gln thioester bond-forming surface protein [Lachnospiraceae bacterium]|nr:Cys-Gln thioester bond-forming surface protein [Lachnospiraceae bacterium]
MNQNKRKNSSLRKILHISVIICLIINIFIFGFEEKPVTKASSYGLDYYVFSQDDYENPYIGHIGNAIIKFLDGKVSYCLQSGKGLQKGVEYTLKEELNWSFESKELLSYVLYYGYQNYYGTSGEQYSDDELACYLATQLLVWQLEYNSFYDTNLTESLIEHYSDLKTNSGVQIGPKVVEYYKEIWTKADIALNGGTPSFTYDSDYIASLNAYILEYNDEKGGYYIEIEDANHYLGNYQVLEENGVEVTISGDKMTIFSQEEMEDSRNVILENPSFAKGMEPLVWTCNDVAFQEITNAKDVVDISKVQYLYIITKPKPEEDSNYDEEITTEENTENSANVNTTEEINTEDSENRITTEEISSEDSGDENITEEISTGDSRGEGTTEEIISGVSEEKNTTEESSTVESENKTEIEENATEEIEKNMEEVFTEENLENKTSEKIEITLPKMEAEETDQDKDGIEENTTEDILFEDEYHYESDTEDMPEGRIIIEKVDGDTKEALPGVTFMISNYDATYSITQETNENGIIDLFLPYGNYYLQEISAPAGYATNNEKISFRITNETPLCFQIINTKVPRLGMNVSLRNLGFSGLLVVLVVFLFKELDIDLKWTNKGK